ncbi:MAG: sulfatase-like hydrolase/transferase [Prolixibacteraceae bacterium]|jgi:N-acetylgalactosamine-6-sulfatase|nr:sulfatase-like hydrolase/transferase [Prolixibacteraceae bacterium]
MNRFFCKSLCVGGLILLFACEKKTTEKSLNIIILLADDLGYGDVGCYGSPAIETPNIDMLAKEGMKFTRFYAGSAVCSPSRASILTGKFPLRMNLRSALLSENNTHLSTKAVIIPEILRTKGYYTALIGKWHLGGLTNSNIDNREKGQIAELPGPLQHGFNHYLATIEGEPPRRKLILNKTMYAESGKYLISDDRRIPPNNKQWDEIKVDEAIAVIDKSTQMKRSFFIDLCFDAPHTPYEAAPEPHYSKYKQMGIEGDQLYFRSRVSHLDAMIGKVYAALNERNLLETTLIILTSDNGSISEGSSGPFKGAKTDLHEGGLRVPFIVVWKGHISAGVTNASIGHHVDILPTICEISKTDTSGLSLDGISLLKSFQNNFVRRKEVLLFQMDKYSDYQGHGVRPFPQTTLVAMKDNWKLSADSMTKKELFNLNSDFQEDFNLLGKHPEIENELYKEIVKFWNAPRLNNLDY